MDLADFEKIGSEDQYLAVIATTRENGTAQASVVNAGVLPHPVTGEHVVGFVTYGTTKLANIRKRPRTTVVFRSGWQWGAVEGPADIIGLDDPFEGFDRSELPELLRAVFRAAGGSHDDWAEYDRVMAEQRRAAVLVHPQRIYSNRG
jgi:PPOX class probable F420-dependent enzyme